MAFDGQACYRFLHGARGRFSVVCLAFADHWENVQGIQRCVDLGAVRKRVSPFSIHSLTSESKLAKYINSWRRAISTFLAQGDEL